MQLSSGSHIPDGLLAAMTLLSEKPRLGVPSWNPALHPGISEANCTAAIGLRASQSLNRFRSRYTGKERDAESGLDYFGARYYASTMGRWTSPDWAAKPEAVPYSSLDNPQSLNLYGYVLNNPLSKADPDGHCCIEEAAQALEEYGPGVEEAFQKYGNQAVGALSGIATAAIAKGSGLLDSITGSLPSLPAGSSAMPGGQGMVTPYLMSKDAAAPVSPDIHPGEISGKTPSEIDATAKGKGLIPKGPDPQGGKGSYVDPATGKQRVLVHPEDGHAHVNNPNGERLGPNGDVVPKKSPDAHLPIKPENQ